MVARFFYIKQNFTKTLAISQKLCYTVLVTQN